MGFVAVDDTKPAQAALVMWEKGESVGRNLQVNELATGISLQSCRFLPARTQRFFGLTVGTKVDCPRRSNPNDVRSQALEERARTFRLHDVFEALEDGQ